MIVLDTSVLTRLDKPAVRVAIEVALETSAVGRTLITDLEIGSSARSSQEFDRLLGYREGMLDIQVGEAEHHRALLVQRELAERGLRGRKIPDLLIAAAAELRGASLLHYDSDFDHIASITGQTCSWVVPRGSVD